MVDPGGLADQAVPLAGGEEVAGKVVEQRDVRAILELPDGGVRPALRVVVALVRVGQPGGGEYGALQAPGTVAADVAGDLAAHREPDQRRVVRVEIRREGVVVVAAPSLRRAAGAAPVVGYDAVSGLHERRHLLLPGHPESGQPGIDTTGLPEP